MTKEVVSKQKVVKSIVLLGATQLLLSFSVLSNPVHCGHTFLTIVFLCLRDFPLLEDSFVLCSNENTVGRVSRRGWGVSLEAPRVLEKGNLTLKAN